jgi:hypothetical protein
MSRIGDAGYSKKSYQTCSRYTANHRDRNTVFFTPRPNLDSHTGFGGVRHADHDGNLAIVDSLSIKFESVGRIREWHIAAI